MKCIILAGGSGERLWPISRDLHPKSLLKLYNGKTLIQNVFELALNLATEKNILTVTNIRQLDDTNRQLKELCSKPNIIAEPMSKNTAAAVASAITYLQGQKDEVVIVLPVDFGVKNVDKFVQAINEAKELAKLGNIVAIGVKPEYSEEGFGYIQAGDKVKKGFKVNKFIEKPKREEVIEILKQDNFYWNTGIYVAKMSVLLQAYKELAPCVNETFENGEYELEIKFSPRYLSTFEQEQNLNAILEDFYSSLNLESMSDYDKLKAVYDYICDNVDYGYQNSSSYSTLFNGIGNCRGYALLFYRMALDLGFDARIISGRVVGGSYDNYHEWNIVKIGDYYYNVDANFGDNAGSYARYTYFLKGSSGIFEDGYGSYVPAHIRDVAYDNDEFNCEYPTNVVDFDKNKVEEDIIEPEESTEEVTEPEDEIETEISTEEVPTEEVIEEEEPTEVPTEELTEEVTEPEIPTETEGGTESGNPNGNLFNKRWKIIFIIKDKIFNFWNFGCW